MSPANYKKSQLVYRPRSAGIPRAISCYSEMNGVIRYNDSTALRRFIVPPENTYLSGGVDVDVNITPPVRRLDAIIEACLLSGAKEKHTFLGADVVTRRGVLTEYDEYLFHCTRD